jgi:hypothetical protein
MTYPLHSKLNIFPINPSPCTLHAFGHSNLFNKNLVTQVLKDLLGLEVMEGNLSMVLPKDELSAESFKAPIEINDQEQPVQLQRKKIDVTIKKKPKGLKYE